MPPPTRAAAYACLVASLALCPSASSSLSLSSALSPPAAPDTACTGHGRIEAPPGRPPGSAGESRPVACSSGGGAHPPGPALGARRPLRGRVVPPSPPPLLPCPRSGATRWRRRAAAGRTLSQAPRVRGALRCGLLVRVRGAQRGCGLRVVRAGAGRRCCRCRGLLLLLLLLREAMAGAGRAAGGPFLAVGAGETLSARALWLSGSASASPSSSYRPDGWLSIGFVWSVCVPTVPVCRH